MDPLDAFWARASTRRGGGYPPKLYHYWRNGRPACAKVRAASPSRLRHRLRPRENACPTCAAMQHGRPVLAGARWWAAPPAPGEMSDTV